jgi:hypothetical protein
MILIYWMETKSIYYKETEAFVVASKEMDYK